MDFIEYPSCEKAASHNECQGECEEAERSRVKAEKGYEQFCGHSENRGENDNCQGVVPQVAEEPSDVLCGILKKEQQ